jgi:acetone carboxylase gamma subunit
VSGGGSEELKIGKVIWRDSGVYCSHCDAEICGVDENWKDHSLARRGLAAEQLTASRFGPSYKLHPNPRVEVAELFCPTCKGLLSVELYKAGEPYRWDYSTLERGRERGYDPVGEFRNDPDSWIAF